MSVSKMFVCNSCNHPCKLEVTDIMSVDTPTTCVYDFDLQIKEAKERGDL